MEIPIGRALRDARKHKKLTQRQLADLVGVPRTYVTRVENSKVIPKLENIFLFAEVMEIEPYKIVRHVSQLMQQVPDLKRAEDNSCTAPFSVQLSA